jgi:hypothetical protein
VASSKSPVASTSGISGVIPRPYRIVIPQIVKRIKDSGYSLIILDPIYKLYGDTDENSAHEVAQMLNELERVCVETDAAIMFVPTTQRQPGRQGIHRPHLRLPEFCPGPDSILPLPSTRRKVASSSNPSCNLPPVEPFVVRWDHLLMKRDDDLTP